MIRSDKIKTAMFGLVGFNNPTDPEYRLVNSTNQTSTTGLKFDEGSNFVTIQNILDCQNDRNISPSEFNTYLANLQNQVIDDVCREIMSEQNKMLYSQNLYPFEKSFKNTLEGGGKFVGFEISPFVLNDKTCKIEFVELAFDGDVTFTLYLYNSNLKTAIKTKEVTTSANESIIIYPSDWFIDDDSTYKGGTFYLGYFENDLGSVKAIARDFDKSTYKTYNYFYSIEPVRVSSIGTVLDVEDVDAISDTYGLNISLNIYNDFTKLFINNKHLFAPAIQFGMAVKVLDLIRTSIRSNITQRLTTDMVEAVNFELYGNSELQIVGVSGKYANRIKTIKKTLFYEPNITMGTLI